MILKLRSFVPSRLSWQTVLMVMAAAPALFAVMGLKFALIGLILGALVARYFMKRGYQALFLFMAALFFFYALAEKMSYGEWSSGAFVAYATAFIGVSFLLIILQHLCRGRGQIVFAGVCAAVGLIAMILPATYIGHIVFFGTPLPPDSFYAIAQTNGAEAWDYVMDYVGIAPFVFVLVMAGGIFWFFMCDRKKDKASFSLILPVLIVAVSFANLDIDDIRLVGNIKNYAQDYQAEITAFRAIQEKKEAFSDLQASKQGAGETAILVIGESLNKRHMGLYGYMRDTTPVLSGLEKDGDLVVFDQAFSSHTHTMQTLSLAMTQASLANEMDYFKAPTLLEVAKAAGYDTYWITNQVLYGAWDNLVSVLAHTADHLVPLNKNLGKDTRTHNYDGASIDALEKILSTPTEKNRLIIIHLMGNHGDYCDRYPADFNWYKGGLSRDEFGRFTKEKTKIQRKLNCYDNSVGYNDYVVGSLIDRLVQQAGKNFLFYFADHGEAVTANKGHASAAFSYDMVHIPALVWASDAYKKAYTQKLSVMQENAQGLYSNEYVYDSMIALMNIRTPAYTPAYDISSPRYSLSCDEAYSLYKEKVYCEPANGPYHVRAVQQKLSRAGQPDRVLPHRVISTGKLADIQQSGLSSYEIDLIFDEKKKVFLVGHDSDKASRYNFEDFLRRTDITASTKIWLDIKNLNARNMDAALARLQVLDKEFSLRAHVIVESSTQDDAFAAIAQAGFHSSYYLPTSAIAKAQKDKDEARLIALSEEIAAQVARQKVSAVSFDAGLYPFVEEYLEKKLPPAVVYHTWDLDLSYQDEDVSEVLRAAPYYSDKRVETILIKFDSEFHL